MEGADQFQVVGLRLHHNGTEGDPAHAVTWAAAVTSLKLEAEGPFRRSLAEAEAFYQRPRRGL